MWRRYVSLWKHTRLEYKLISMHTLFAYPFATRTESQQKKNIPTTYDNDEDDDNDDEKRWKIMHAHTLHLWTNFQKHDSISPSHITRFCSPVFYNRFSLSHIAFGKIHAANLFYAISKNGECVPKFKGLISSIHPLQSHYAIRMNDGKRMLISTILFFSVFLWKKNQ